MESQAFGLLPGTRFSGTLYQLPLLSLSLHCKGRRTDAHIASCLRLCLFLLSGLIHACGLYTHFGSDGSFSSGTLVFFCIQPVGIVAQQVALAVLLRICPSLQLRVSRCMWNAAFAFAWMVLVAPLFLNEYATAGVWLAEPVPVSLFRGLGFGFEGKRQWWVWDGPWAEVSWGRRWWESKIQFA
ncbi:hypothetical protein IFM61606_04840 [Aspergillus udagawae]|nr:hypothetical protein IFM61606_04840 [Aspergillus udagawae]